MDDTDKKILQLLEENARETINEIARQVSLSAPAVKERITKMEESGIIDRYTIKTNPKKLGKSVTAFIMFETVNCKVFREFCSGHKMVLECHRIAGYYSYLVKVMAEDMEELEKFIDETMTFGSPSTHIVLSTTENKIFDDF